MTLTIRSTDGTRLAVRRRDAGTPIVLVHGTTGTVDTFARIERALAENHTVWVYDRRGRGGSGDVEPYALEREVDDLLDVLETAGPNAHLVGHSFGAVCALLAATRRPRLRTLTLYEPPLRFGRAVLGALDAAVSYLAGGDLQSCIAGFFAIAGITAAEAQAMCALPQVWADVCEGARRAARELLALRRHDWDEHDFASITTPTLLLSGSRTQSARATRLLANWPI